MIEINLILTPKRYSQALKIHYRVNGKKWRVYRIAFASVCVLLGCFFLFFSMAYSLVMGVTLLAAGIMTFFSQKLSIREEVKRIFPKKCENIEVNLRASDEKGVMLSDKHSSSQLFWSAFINYELDEMGVLLYPCRDIFYWISVESEFVEGDWDAFVDMVTSNVSKKK